MNIEVESVTVVEDGHMRLSQPKRNRFMLTLPVETSGCFRPGNAHFVMTRREARRLQRWLNRRIPLDEND